jgi:type III pantothenate kinase
MSNTSDVLIIDAGNTAIKAAIYRNGKLLSISRFDLNDESLQSFLEQKKQLNGAISTVLDKQSTERILKHQTHLLVVNATSKLPLTIDYKSPETLGIDRICNACGMIKTLSTDFGVSIDIGTCIKFDLIDKSGIYSGGSISPGINLRYQSLNDYTGNLPLLSNKNAIDYVGKTTIESIQSGVINGINAEINGMMNQYREAYPSLTFFVTGGDSKYFDLHSKNDIFADDNLTLNGLFEIYNTNA